MFEVFQMFQKYVSIVLYGYTKVDRDVTHVASVLEVCSKSLFKIFHLFQMYVASVSGCCTCYNGYVACVCSKCFSCFSRMLQLFHLSVAKINLNVGWSNEEERTSAGAMAALVVSWRQRSTGGRAQASALAYATLEWVLIALLLINNLLAYTIAIVREPSWCGDAGAADVRGTRRGVVGASN
jgi:hypothetical protein